MDAYDTRKKNWEDLDVTREELNNFTECLKKEEFRKLLIEYAEEVSNPDNRKIYETEIKQLEKERGVDVTFVNPEPGYVIKTSLNGDKKCFVNISKSDKVAKPTSQPTYEDGHRGLQWSIPYSLAPPREDLDKKNSRCTVFDVVFHPDTLYLASKNHRFADIVNNTAMDGVENSFKVNLDRKNLKFPKMSFKGIGQSTVIRKPCEKSSQLSEDLEPEIYQKLMSSYDENIKRHSQRVEEKPPSRASPPSTYYTEKKSKTEIQNSCYTVPKFTVKHQSDVDLQDYRDSMDAKINATIPTKLIVVVDLPLLKTASDASLDVQERSLTVTSEKPAKYKLELPLPYCVNADTGNAKFDPKHKKLTVTLPVLRKTVKLADLRDDSGVESDHGSPLLGLSDEMSAISPENSYSELESSENSSFKSAPSITVLSEFNGVESYHENTALRTNNSADSKESFMNDNIKYALPPFVCNIYDGNLAITVNVKNVDSESIRHKTLDGNSGIHIILSSIGAGFFPVYYSLCMKIHENAVVPKSLTVEPWDNNVVFTIQLQDTKDLSQYCVGLDEEFMETKELPCSMSLTRKFEDLMVEPPNGSDKTIQVVAEGEDIVINIQSNNLDSDDELDKELLNRSSRKKERKQHSVVKSRSVSESSGDDLPSSNGSSVSKGILKSRRSTFSRSVSESSIDDTTGLVSSIDCHYDSIHDMNSESECSSFKKSVRFNDVVSRQLYRSNSSILGQRKKNQRKLKNKKRAHDRRMSESENSETEDREKYRMSSKDDSTESKSHDTVKPILNRDKLSEHKKTGTIKIEKFQNNVNINLHKTKRDTNDSVEKNLPMSDDSRAIDGTITEFKNDLIFDLDM